MKRCEYDKESPFKGSMWHNEFPNPTNPEQQKERMSREYDSIAKIYWTIGEVAEIFNEATSALRYWEDKLPWVKVKKGKKGDRRYTGKEIESMAKVVLLVRWLGVTELGLKQAHKLGYYDKLVEIAKQEKEKANEINNHG